MNEFTASASSCYPTIYALNPTSPSSYTFKRDCSSDSLPLSVDCRTVVYSRLVAGNFNFKIDVTGPVNALVSPDITINVACANIVSPYGTTITPIT